MRGRARIGSHVQLALTAVQAAIAGIATLSGTPRAVLNVDCMFLYSRIFYSCVQ